MGDVIDLDQRRLPAEVSEEAIEAGMEHIALAASHLALQGEPTGSVGLLRYVASYLEHLYGPEGAADRLRWAAELVLEEGGPRPAA